MMEENEHDVGTVRSREGVIPMKRQAGVPVSMGSGGSRTLRVGGLTVTHAWFPAASLLDRHTHDHPVLAVMLAGGFDLKISGRLTPCMPATVFTEPAGESHSNLVGTAGAVVAVIQPDPGHEWPLACSRLFDSISHFRDGRIAGLGRRLAEEFDASDDLAALSIEGVALELIALAGRRSSTRGAPAGPPWLGRIEAMIHERFLERLHIDDLAREADLHPAHLARAFRAHYNVTIAAYVRGLRLDWAARRLAATNDSLSTIAHRAGFADQSHFTRAFRKHAGVPPGEYRRIRRHRKHA
jgi:AraC family transcriptional regulator